MVHITLIRALPESEGCNSLVNLEFRKGTWSLKFRVSMTPKTEQIDVRLFLYRVVRKGRNDSAECEQAGVDVFAFPRPFLVRSRFL